MAMQFRTVQLGTPRHPDEGLRLGTVRFLPRGVKKSDYAKLNYFDIWLPQLAPSASLIQGLKSGKLPFATFSKRYRKELQATDARQLVQLLASMAQHTPLSVGCYCEDESQCHRSVLGDVIRKASGASVSSE